MLPIDLIALVGFGLPISEAQKTREKSWHFVQPEIWLVALTGDQAVPMKFEIQNELGTPLKIISTDASCRCIVLNSAPGEVPPHGSGVFQWTFSAARSRGTIKDSVSITGGDGRTLVGIFGAFVSEEPPKTARPAARSSPPDPASG